MPSFPLNDSQLWREIIVDHYQHPRNFGFTRAANCHCARKKNAGCVDDITIEINYQNQKIKTARFEGTACAICTASTDILLKLITNQTIKQSHIILDNYLQMIHHQSNYKTSLLKEAVAFQTIYLQPNRIKCAILSVLLLKELLNEKIK